MQFGKNDSHVLHADPYGIIMMPCKGKKILVPEQTKIPLSEERVLKTVSSQNFIKENILSQAFSCIS